MSNNDAERRLILLSAGTAQRRAAARVRAAQLARDVDWGRFTATLYSRRLLSLLGPRILELAGGAAEEDFSAAVARAHESGRRQGQFLQMLTLRILELFAAAGIRAAPLKGPLLGEAIHGDPGRRLSSDVDFLIAPEQLQQAVRVARGLGYGDPTDHLLAGGLPLLHLRMLDSRGKLPPLELHWRVHWYERDFARERLLPPSAGPWEGWRPAPADELAALLLFYARDGFIDLRIATDLSAWWDARGGELEAEGNARGRALADAAALARGGPPEEAGGPMQRGALAGLLGAYPQFARALPAAAHVAQNIVGLPAARLFDGALGPRERLAVRLANPHPTSTQSQLYADMGLVDGLLAPRGGFREFVRRQLLPPEEVLDQQARHGERSGARSAAARFLGVLGRYGLTVARSTVTRTRARAAGR